MQCPKCGVELNSQAQFCWKCGAGVAAAPTIMPAPAREEKKKGNAALIVALLALLLMLFAVGLILFGGGRGKPVTTAAHPPVSPGNPVTATPPTDTQPVAPVTASPPTNTQPAAPVTATPPANTPAGQPVAGGPQRPADYNDVAAYLKWLESVERRDAQNPMAQLTGMMTALMVQVSGGLKDLNPDNAGTQDASKQIAETDRTFAGVYQAKEALTREHHTHTPVPLSCQLLHRTYGAYLDAQLRAIAELRDAMKTQNAAGAMGALPLGTAAATAQKAAEEQEDAIRKLYGIPRSIFP